GTTLSAAPTLVTGGDAVQVTMALTASGAVANVTPGTLTVTDLNSAGASVNPANCGTAQLASADDDIANANDPVVYTWTCTAQAGAGIGNLTFSGAASGDGGSTTFAAATSNSVLVSPALSYQAKVVNPDISGLGEIVNTAYIKDATVIPLTESNEVTTTLPVGSIGDFIFYDNPTNPNGLPDGGEAGIPDVTVTLYRVVNGVPQVYAIQITNGSGLYQFTNLPFGEYIVEAEEQTVNAPCDAAIPPQVPCNPAEVGRMVPTTGEQTFTLTAANPNVTTADQGFIEGALLEGHVFHDVDHNGVLNIGEPGLPNVTVGLYEADCTTAILNGGQPVTTQTNAAGEYDFLVAPGDYCVAYDTNDGDIPGNLTEQTTPTQLLVQNVVSGQERKNIDFGLDDPGKIGGTVYLDPANPGVQDPNEPGLEGVTVILKDSNGNTIDTQATDPNGDYLFVGLPTNTTYTVEAVPPGGYTPTVPNPSITTGITPDNLDVNFGMNVLTVTLSGRVYDDQNNSGDDEGEPGFPNVDVTVVCDGKSYAVATDGNGDWSVSVPSGSDCTAIQVDENDVPPTYQVNETATPPGIVTTNVTGLDTGFVNNPGSITGTVCDVASSGSAGNGTCDGNLDEPGINGVTVTLVGAGQDGILGTTDDITQTTTTNSSGVYNFTDLGPGLYRIVETNLPNYDSVADVDGGNPDVINRMSGPSIPLLAGESATGRDFEDALLGTPDFAIEKTLIGQDPFRTGDLLSFRIRITNTGDFPITFLALRDTYDTVYLTYAGSTPPSDDNIGDGVIDWSDLTAGQQVNGCGVDLAVNAVCEVVVDFVAKLDTSLLQPDSKTENTATTNGVEAGNLTIPDKSDSARVQVTSPTAVLVINRAATADGDAILLHWETTNESNMATFMLYRVQADGTRVAVLAQPLPAQHAGQPTGAAYDAVDAGAASGGFYRYELEVVGLDGGVSLLDMGAVTTGEHTYLPLVHSR
ncbi:MAG: carboxypeptidase regulatory-like domain-containing protein, partial [Caldilineaceae bacterium]|nr:carboxypeptidase regulatory-like domain-containing protein [Caldilineaceae bacterium]